MGEEEEGEQASISMIARGDETGRIALTRVARCPCRFSPLCVCYIPRSSPTIVAPEPRCTGSRHDGGRVDIRIARPHRDGHPSRRRRVIVRSGGRGGPQTPAERLARPVSVAARADDAHGDS